MSAPIPPIVLSSAQGPGLLPLLEALQQRRAASQRANEFATRQDFMERQLALQQQNKEAAQAAEFLLAGIRNDPNFATSDTATELERAAGLSGFGKAIATAQQQTRRDRVQAFEALFEPGDTESGVAAGPFAGVSDGTKGYLRAKFTLAQSNVQMPSEVDQRLADHFEVPQTEREQLDLQLKQMEAEQRRQNVARFTRRNTLANQQRVAEALGLSPADATSLSRAGVDFIDIYERATARGDSSGDPSNQVVSVALRLLSATSDVVGRPQMLPAQALQQARDLLASVNPATYDDIDLTGSAAFQTGAMRDVMGKVAEFRAAGNRLDGRRLSDRQAREQLRKDLVARLSPDELSILSPVLDEIFRLAFERHPR